MESKISVPSSRYYRERRFSSGNEGKDYSSFETQVTSAALSDNFSTDQRGKASLQNSKIRKEQFKLVPIKEKDLRQIIQTDPQNTGKLPITMNLRESEIGNIIEKQNYYNSSNTHLGSGSLKLSLRLSPISKNHAVEQNDNTRHSYQQGFSSPNDQTSLSHSEHQLIDKKYKPPLGENQSQVYAMTGIQAYPMIGGGRNAFRAKKSRKKTPRQRSRKKIEKESKPSRMKLRSRSRKPKSRGRSKRRRSTRKIVRVRSSMTPRETVIVRNKRRPVSQIRRVSRIRRISPPNTNCCTPYPLYNCSPFTDPRTSCPINCNYNLCQEKLQFIQPCVCPQRKYTWTNEYAVIPKPQINLIDPCKELDPLIYPRAERPCIRDGRGRPLTDCIGRPLRDPIGKTFLNFSDNGSVMDTHLRGNFFTGQPPLCVKQPFPEWPCCVNNTQYWWRSCGYPAKADMGPFYNRVLAADHAKRRL